MQPVHVDEAQSKARVVLAAAQLLLICTLLWLLFTGETDSTSLEVDWAFVVFAIVAPLSLAVSYWAGRRYRRRASEGESSATRLFARAVQGLTVALLVAAAITFPLAVLGELFLDVG
ncbi:membrane hypothetical protein [metagenome]|uniref:Uncharacterized protein n=1 Tax=metagenome TaxID=256318 RepID=A0A2P2BXT1_9ZZZZ